MKTLSVVGTAAMLMVGGGILTHGIAPLGVASEHVAGAAGSGLLPALIATVLSALCGIVAGAITLGVVGGIKRLAGDALVFLWDGHNYSRLPARSSGL